jgi:peptidyl-prolyl cis-trans isomerase D
VLQQMRSAAKWIWWFVVIAFVGGFLLLDTSGLLGRDQVGPSTTVATVNGVEIPYLTWLNLSNSIAQQREQGSGRGLSLDERRDIDNQAFEQLVNEVLLEQEYRRRGITVSDEEVLQAAQSSPPPMLMGDPSLQTDGQFDIEKYRRFLASPQARQQGLLLQLESYYRSEIPRAKLYDQIMSTVWVSDDKLWNVYKDAHDSAWVSFVTFAPTTVPDSAVQVSEAEVRRFYDADRERFRRQGRAVLSLLTIPRAITAADTAATRDRMLALRQQIVDGARFEDVASAESVDSVSAANGGSLGMSARDRFTPEFANAAARLRVGELSQPVLTPDGYHLIRLDARKGDSINVRHILKRIQQSDSSATATDRAADQLARIAASATEPQRFDSAARALSLQPQSVQAFEGQPVFTSAGIAPGVSAWAFGGPRPGETSDLFDSEQAYFLARLDTLVPSGIAPYDEVKNDIRALLMLRKKAEALVPDARALAQEAAATSLDDAAKKRDITVNKTNAFARPTFVPGMGRLNAAVGAAFSLPIGRISEPIVTDDGVFVMRVDRRAEASREEWEKQKDVQRQQTLNALRQARLRNFLEGLREKADLEDRRQQINAAARQQAQ